jgi:uncharacterized repeat protein (TIGR01451 family)
MSLAAGARIQQSAGAVSIHDPIPGIVVGALMLLAAGAVPAASPSERASAAAPSPDVPEQGAPIATGTGPLVTSTVVELLEVVQDSDGRERRRFVPADRVRAGDEVYYTIRVQNPGRTAVRNVVVTKQLPFGMHYARGSAVGPAAEVQFSVDGGETFAAAAELEVRVGGQPPRRATVDDYTHVRWRLRAPLAPGATALLRFRASLS